MCISVHQWWPIDLIVVILGNNLVTCGNIYDIPHKSCAAVQGDKLPAGQNDSVSFAYHFTNGGHGYVLPPHKNNKIWAPQPTHTLKLII